MFFNAVLCTETVLFLRLCFVKLFFNQSVQGSYKQMSCKAAAKKQQAGNVRVAKHVCILVAWWKEFFFGHVSGTTPVSNIALNAASKTVWQSVVLYFKSSATKPCSSGDLFRRNFCKAARSSKVDHGNSVGVCGRAGWSASPWNNVSRFHHPQQHPHLSSVHVLAVTPASMLPSWWWNVLDLNKPVFSISGPPTDAVFEFERSKFCVLHGVVFAALAAEVTVDDKTAWTWCADDSAYHLSSQQQAKRSQFPHKKGCPPMPIE